MKRWPFVLVLLFCLLNNNLLIAQTAAIKKQADDLCEKGKSSLANKQYDKAIVFFTNAIKLNPAVFKYYHNRGLAYLNKSKTLSSQQKNLRLDSAVRDLSKSLQLNPEFWKTYWVRAQTYMEYYTYPTYPKLELAIADFTKGLEYDKNNYQLYVERGNAYTKDPYQYHDEAIADFNKAIEINNTESFPYLGKADMEKIKNEYAAAIADYSKSLSLAKTNNDKAYILISQGRAYELNDMPEKAVINYADANKLFPSKQIEDMETAATKKVVEKVGRNISSQSANLPDTDSLLAALDREYKQKQAEKATQQTYSNQNNNNSFHSYSNSHVCPACGGSGWIETFGRKMEYVDIKDWQGRIIGSEFKPVDGFHSEKCSRCGGSGKN